MAARAALATLIGTDPQMNMLGLDQESVFGSNATDSPPRTHMFAVIHWDDAPRQPGGLSKYMVTVWFHIPREVERDYGKIDLALLRIKELSRTLEQLEGADGWVLTAMSWQGSSPDLPDDGYNSLTRFAQFACACRNVE